jgi:hypothetical protein
MSQYAKQYRRNMVAACIILASVILVLMLAGCQTLPQPPKVVTKVVTEYRAIPAWAVAEVPNDPPASQSVKAITESNNRRGEALDYVNCRSRLLEKLGMGESVSPKECKP